MKVAAVGYAFTNAYYVQPYIAAPFTDICSDGTWSMFTHEWGSFIVLLVDKTTFGTPPSILYTHPSLLPGVLAWAEYPPTRTVNLGGYTFETKRSDPYFVDPGPCRFSDSQANVAELTGGGVRLTTANHNDIWTCSEIVLDHSLGYGTYSWQIGNRLDLIDPNAVAAGFIYDEPGKEFDIEVSRALMPPPNLIQFVVQPYYHDGNLFRFVLPPSDTTSYRMVWQADHIDFTSWIGPEPYPPSPENVIASWTYTGLDIPAPGTERMRFNLWLYGGYPPVTSAESAMDILSFSYVP